MLIGLLTIIVSQVSSSDYSMVLKATSILFTVDTILTALFVKIYNGKANLLALIIMLVVICFFLETILRIAIN